MGKWPVGHSYSCDDGAFCSSCAYASLSSGLKQLVPVHLRPWPAQLLSWPQQQLQLSITQEICLAQQSIQVPFWMSPPPTCPHFRDRTIWSWKNDLSGYKEKCKSENLQMDRSLLMQDCQDPYDARLFWPIFLHQKQSYLCRTIFSPYQTYWPFQNWLSPCSF